MNLHSSCYPCWCEKEIYIQIKSLQPQESLLDKFWLLQEKDLIEVYGLWDWVGNCWIVKVGMF